MTTLDFWLPLRGFRALVGRGLCVLAAVTLIAISIVDASVGAATASTPGFRLRPQATTSVESTLTGLFLTAEKRTHTLTPGAKVYLVTSYDYVGSDGKTHPGKRFSNPLVVDGPGHESWAYAFFDPVAHSKLHDQVALQDGNNVALFVANPTWRLLRIGLGIPECKTSVLVKSVPAPVAGLWIARHCQ